ncbi:MAG: EamA family transporter [archaeon]|nr:EamA family transporter [archaeon]
MLNEGIIFAVLTAVSLGAWTVFHNQASPHINPIFGAIIVSLTAVIVGTIFLIPQIKNTTLFSNTTGIIFVILAGVLAFAIDYFALKAYASGINVSIAGPIIVGGSAAVASVIGFIFLHEPITLAKIAGMALIIIGAIVLTAF